MIKKIDITNPGHANEVHHIQILSYRIEAEIIDFYDIPPLKDTVESLQQCGEDFFGYYVNGRLCGVISIQADDKGVIDIHRLMVHPNYFRRGIARKLLAFIEGEHSGIETIIVSTGTKNAPAIAFYLKNGFVKMGEKKVVEGLSLSFFKKTCNGRSYK